MLFSGSCGPRYRVLYVEDISKQSEIKVGHCVEVTTKDKKQYKFIAWKITEDHIEGEKNNILYTDIYNIEKSADNNIIIYTETSPYLKILQFLDDVYYFYYLEY
ncbi:MAG: hypothetical protein GWO07_09765 [Candidatus Dadabacteria bacterium]|nr:hypothetical protein [Candidatus Dadabacteria bacterium]NIS09034.1 hypothetical protein [Candidatus Dadabacteria bacterium]NIX15628.1 hypothetical protein [Candidatus Dadabacteria bacterium]NIY22370.1 hypothetical protein [Candidatus Dadabacteria bacterium]